jgi:LysM repeat protein
MWTKSACVVLAWSILTIILVAVGMTRPVRPAQANLRIASNTEITLASTLSVAAESVTAPRPARYVVQPGNTLSGIAARFDVRGGWPALYAANRPVIGPDPDVIDPGIVLVLPGQTPVRYKVVPGDTLTGIAAALSVRGGWPALYAANRRVIGPDPNAIRPGTMLTVPGSAAAPSRASGPGRRLHPMPPSAPTSSRHRPPPTPTRAPTASRMPQWLKTMLLAVALLIGTAFLAEPALAVGRRRRRKAATGPAQRRSARPVSGKAHIVLADHDRLVVTRSTCDDTTYVLRPPGEDPKAILRAARLVMPEAPYEELADQLGVPAGWPLE